MFYPMIYSSVYTERNFVSLKNDLDFLTFNLHSTFLRSFELLSKKD